MTNLTHKSLLFFLLCTLLIYPQISGTTESVIVENKKDLASEDSLTEKQILLKSFDSSVIEFNKKVVILRSQYDSVEKNKNHVEK